MFSFMLKPTSSGRGLVPTGISVLVLLSVLWGCPAPADAACTVNVAGIPGCVEDMGMYTCLGSVVWSTEIARACPGRPDVVLTVPGGQWGTPDPALVVSRSNFGPFPAGTTTVRFDALYRIEASLVLSGTPGLVRVDVPGLSHVSGAVEARGFGGATLGLPSLGTVYGTVRLDDTRLAAFVLPRLSILGGSMLITRNPALTTVSLPNLGGVPGDLTVTGNRVLADVTFMPYGGTIDGTTTITGNPLRCVSGEPAFKGFTIEVAQNVGGAWSTWTGAVFSPALVQTPFASATTCG